MTIRTIPQPALWAAQFAFWLIAFVLCFVLFAGCGGTAGLFGLASTADLNDESKRLQEFARAEAAARQTQTHKAIVNGTKPLDAIFPEFSESVEAQLADSPYKPTPEIPELPEEGAFPWWAEEATAVGLSTVLAYLGVNTVRDRKRRMRGEAVTSDEAAQKGYFEDGVSQKGTPS